VSPNLFLLVETEPTYKRGAEEREREGGSGTPLVEWRRKRRAGGPIMGRAQRVPTPRRETLVQRVRATVPRSDPVLYRVACQLRDSMQALCQLELRVKQRDR
jgi:hypothetical protein